MQVQLRVAVTNKIGSVTLLLLMQRINCGSKAISIRQDSDGPMAIALTPTSTPRKKSIFVKILNSITFNYIICFSVFSAFLLEGYM